jgi:hypothetical protein
MAERTFCIDMGSAFTKVALRADPAADAQLVSPLGGGSAVAFCVPTVVSVERRADSRQQLEFGPKATGMTDGGGIRVFRNWKKSIFLRPKSDDAHHSPLEALLASGEMADLATRFDVPPAQLHYLRQMAAAARGMAAGPGRPLSADSHEHRTAGILAAHFFKWLREQILAACDRLPGTGLKYEAIPVRLTVPAFAHGRGVETHPGCQVLTEALTRAGWPVHPEQPLVTEPYSNAVGVLTKGKNCLLRAGSINLGGMFANGPLMTVLKDASHHPSYRAMVIDVGAFTTDFAGLELNTEGKTVIDPDAAFAVSQHSVPVGVSDLDSLVAAALPADKAAWLRSAPGYDVDAFRRSVYAEGKPFSTNTVGRIGAGLEAEMIREAVQSFGRQLAGAVAEFCDGRTPAAMQELILSGGGSAIPAVRDALQQAAQTGGNSYIRTHAPALRKAAGGPPVGKLDVEMARGGSALGGTSIYFERRYYEPAA